MKVVQQVAAGCANKDTIVKAAYFIEYNDVLAEAVEKKWSQPDPDSGLPVYQRLGKCVFDLFRQSCRLLVHLLSNIPKGDALLILFGSPCQQLTTLGPGGGEIGVCGKDSVLFCAIPTLIWFVQTFRPDIFLLAVGENAGTTKPLHQEFMLHTLGIGTGANPTHYCPAMDAAAWTAAPRNRIFPANFVAINPGLGIPKRPPPWEPNWRKPEQPTTLTRSRGVVDGKPFTSTYQYCGRHMVVNVEIFPGKTPLHEVIHKIRTCMDDEARIAWDKLQAGYSRDRSEEAVMPAVLWLARFGEQNGIRIPSIRERARVFGMEGYLMSLELSEIDLFDAIGNMYDYQAMVIRIGPVVSDWDRHGRQIETTRAVSPQELMRAYEKVKAVVEQKGLSAEPSPYPHDLRHLPESIHGWGKLVQTAQPALPKRRRLSYGRESGLCPPPPAFQRADSVAAAGGDPMQAAQVEQFLALGQWGLPIKGQAGGHPDRTVDNTCVVDSLQQLIMGTPPGSLSAVAGDAAEATANSIRAIYRDADSPMQGRTTLPIAGAWAVITARHFAPRAPRPLLLELVMEQHTGEWSPHRHALHASYGPWDGRVYAVATTQGFEHTIPITWQHAHGGITCHIEPPAHQFPLQQHITTDFDVPSLFAVYHNMRVLRRVTREHDATNTDAHGLQTAWGPRAWAAIGDRTRHLDDGDLGHALARDLRRADYPGGDTRTDGKGVAEEVHVLLLDGDFDIISEPGSSIQAPAVQVVRQGASSQSLCLLLHTDAAVWARAIDVDTVQRLLLTHDTPAAEHGRQV